jgi:hypothetical protein
MNSNPIILHPAFTQAREALARALVTDMPGQLIFVVGLSGAGKSEIRYAAMQAFAGSPEVWAPGRLPVIALRAAATDRSSFSSKEFMTRFYLELLEPNVGWLKERSGIEDPDLGHLRTEARLTSPLWKELRHKSSEHQLRGYVERMAVARGVRAVFVEEAASLTYTHRQKHPGDHAVNYMCLAEEIAATFVFFGVPRMSVLWEGNAEIRRRSRFVFVNRYRLDSPVDRQNFERLAVSLASGYRFTRADLLRRNLDLAYASSAGVFGELKSYLMRADDLRAAEGADTISKLHLEEAVYTENALTTLHDDARAFDLLRTPASAAAIRRSLNDR